jgi:radical SAM superfamily enzyme YgiQ (UPF0313 family)
MHILFYVPDNEVTRNFLPHLWPFLLQSLTPKEHRVTIIDGNNQHYRPEQLVNFIVQNQVDLVGMGFMTRMAQSAYRMAAAIRQATTVPIVMGGPHVSAVPDEPLGLTGHPRCSDAVVVGEADDIWPLVVRDAASGQLQRVYRPATVAGKEVKPSLVRYPVIAWEDMDLAPFDLMRFVPAGIKKLLRHFHFNYDKVYGIPVETGRGCPYGCDFCTVTGFFGHRLRFRTNENVIGELLRLKAAAKRNNGLPMVFFVDDNFAIDRTRTKSLLRDMIRHDACLPWTGQISINLLQDEELVQLIAATGGRWLFIGLESVHPDSLKEAGKEFNKPAEYKAILTNLAKYDVYAITSFIFGMEADRPGVARRTIQEINSWPACLPVFGLLTPYPGTPLYNRLQQEQRLTRPNHWLDFQAFKTAFVPKELSHEEAEDEVRQAWSYCYSPAAFRRAQQWLVENKKSFGYQLMHFVSRLLFRGIYFRQMNRWAYLKLLVQNARTVASLVRSGFRRRGKQTPVGQLPHTGPVPESPTSP